MSKHRAIDLEIGREFKDEKRNIVIIDRKIKTQHGRYEMFYKYRCNNCGYECEDGYRSGKKQKGVWYSKNQILTRKASCACCNHSITIPKINSIRATNPDLSKYFMNDDDLRYAVASNQKTNLKCPICGNIRKDITISTLKNHGFYCEICSNTDSLGERIMYHTLKQIGIEFKKEYVFNHDKHRYDFYIPKLNTIIEIHGEQHYIDSSKYYLDGQKEIDLQKKKFALNHGIKYYIVINARQSDFNYIKNFILKSKLNEIIDMSKIDWNTIHYNVLHTNKVVEICKYWNNHPNLKLFEMEKKFHLSETTIRKYLKLGISQGWCKKRDNHVLPKQYPILYKNKIYFRNMKICSNILKKEYGISVPVSTIRYKLDRNDLDFKMITKQEFNDAYDSNKLCYGNKYKVA